MHDPTETCPHGQPLDNCGECTPRSGETVLCELDGYRITASWLPSADAQRPEDAWLCLRVQLRAIDADGRRGWRIDPTAGVSLPCAAVDALRALLTCPHGQALDATAALHLDASLAQEARLWGVGDVVAAVSLRGHWYRVQAGSADAEGVRNAALTTSEIGVPDLHVGDLTSGEQAGVLAALQAEAVGAVGIAGWNLGDPPLTCLHGQPLNGDCDQCAPPARANPGCDRHPSAWVDDLYGRLKAATLDGCLYCFIDSLAMESRRAEMGAEVLRERVKELAVWAQNAAMGLDEERCSRQIAIVRGMSWAKEVAALVARLQPDAVAAEVARRTATVPQRTEPIPPTSDAEGDAPWYEAPTATDDQDDAMRAEMQAEILRVDRLLARLQPDAVAAEVTRQIAAAATTRTGPMAPWYEAPTAANDRDDAVFAEMRGGFPGKKETP